MRNLLATCVMAALVFAVPAAPASAQQKKTQRAPGSEIKGDPNEIVCETITMLGSRLAKKRACATRAEWAERRRLDQMDIDKAQRMPCVVTGASERC